jgi:hypothetical protein
MDHFGTADIAITGRFRRSPPSFEIRKVPRHRPQVVGVFLIREPETGHAGGHLQLFSLVYRATEFRNAVLGWGLVGQHPIAVHD